MLQYRKVKNVEAERFIPRPSTVVGGLWSDWRVSRNSVTDKMFISVGNGQIANEGNWIIKEPDGSWRVMTHELFSTCYALAESGDPNPDTIYIGIESARDEFNVELVTKNPVDARVWRETPIGKRFVEVWTTSKRDGEKLEVQLPERDEDANENPRIEHDNNGTPVSQAYIVGDDNWTNIRFRRGRRPKE